MTTPVDVTLDGYAGRYLELQSDLSSLPMTGAGKALFLVNEQEERREWWVLGFDTQPG